MAELFGPRQELVLKLKAFWRREGNAARERMAQRLGAGFGRDGRLAPHQRRRGTPLGRNLPQHIRKSRVVVTATGFAIQHRGGSLILFDRGDPGPPRPVIGLPAREPPEITRRASTEIARQLQNALRRLR